MPKTSSEHKKSEERRGNAHAHERIVELLRSILNSRRDACSVESVVVLVPLVIYYILYTVNCVIAKK